MAIEDFLQQKKHSKKELRTALKVIKTFKKGEDLEEWSFAPFSNWAMLELLEDYLKRLT